MQATDQFIARLPKAELHLHLEGSVTPQRLSRLSRKHRTPLAERRPEEIAEMSFKYADFADFLSFYKTICEHLKEPDDYVEVFDDLVESLIDQKVLYAEIIYSPSIPRLFGSDAGAILETLLERAAEVGRKTDLQVRWILDCVRQFGLEAADETVDLGLRLHDQGVVGLGLGGDENSMPMAEFQPVFQRARANGLYAHVHAGEIGEPAQIWDALKILGANRIGHGIQAARDPKLMAYLKTHAIALDVCLTSNLMTGAWRPVSSNPFGLLHSRGVPLTLNTDDPGLFKTNLNREYGLAARHFGLSEADLSYISLQGIRSAFLPYSDKMSLMQRFQDEIHNLQNSG